MHGQSELGGRFAQRVAGGAAVLILVVNVEQDAIGLGQRQILADAGRGLAQRLDDLGRDLGDAQQDRAEGSLDDRADLVGMQLERRLGHGLVGDLVLGEGAEQRVGGLLPWAVTIESNVAPALMESKAAWAASLLAKTSCSMVRVSGVVKRARFAS